MKHPATTLTHRRFGRVLLIPILLTFTSVAFISCSSTTSVAYESVRRQAKPDDYPIDIWDAKDVKRPYKTIGFVRVNAGAKFNITNPIETLKKEARKIGADALLDLTVNGVGAGMISNGSGFYSGHARDDWKAMAIVWTD